MPVAAPSISVELKSQLVLIVGDKNVLSQPADMYLYSFDSALDRALPAAVVLPQTPEQVSQLVRVLSKNKRAFVARGAATSLCGGPIPLENAVVIALARLNRISKFDAAKQEAVVEPGVVNLKLQELANASGLFYAPDPGSQKACTLGGNVATNAGGPHCLKYGVTSHFVMGLEWVFPDGQQLQLRVEDPGYDIVGFLVGSEGTLGVATRIRLRLLPKPKAVRTMLVSFSSIEDAIQSVTDIIADGVLPATLEAMDKTTITAVEAFSNAGYPLNAEAVLLIEVDGDSAAALDEQVVRIQKKCEQNRSMEFRFAKDEAERKRLWDGRRGAYPAMARLAPNVLVEDGAVPRTLLPEALKRIKAIALEYGLRVALLFHAGDGNLHPQIVFDERDKEQTRRVKEAGMKMLKVCVDLGGTISGEHGIGIDKREAMKWLFTRETLSLFRRLKNAFDPENLCNPDKLIPLVGKSAAPRTRSSKKKRAWSPSVDGIVSPASEEQLVALVKYYASQKTRFGVTGLRTKFSPQEAVLISTACLSKVLDFDRGNFTLTVQSGVPVDVVRAAVEKEKCYLWVAGPGSIGGVIAAKSSVVPPLRDLILAMRVLLPTGEIVSLGAKTMKNVAGYDVAKLLLGSWGTLGIILDVTFRLFPYPAAELRSAPLCKPFVFRDLHKKIKKAFDPLDLMSTRTSTMTESDIQVHPRRVAEKRPRTALEKLPKRTGINFGCKKTVFGPIEKIRGDRRRVQPLRFLHLVLSDVQRLWKRGAIAARPQSIVSRDDRRQFARSECDGGKHRFLPAVRRMHVGLFFRSSDGAAHGRGAQLPQRKTRAARAGVVYFFVFAAVSQSPEVGVESVVSGQAARPGVGREKNRPSEIDVAGVGRRRRFGHACAVAIFVGRRPRPSKTRSHSPRQRAAHAAARHDRSSSVGAGDRKNCVHAGVRFPIFETFGGTRDIVVARTVGIGCGDSGGGVLRSARGERRRVAACSRFGPKKYRPA